MKSNTVTFYLDVENPPKACIIPCEDNILVKWKGGELIEKAIRYVPGEPSIYKDEQSPSATRRAQNVVIRNGVLVVNKTEVSLLNFLRNCNYNGSNERRKESSNVIFFETVPGKDSHEYLVEEKSKIAIQYKVLNMGISDIEALAYGFGMQHVSNQMSADLRKDVLIMATNKPDVFETIDKNMDLHRVKHTIIKGIEAGQVIIQNNRVVLRGGSQVFECDFGLDILTEFAKFCMSTSGKSVYANIFSIVKPDEKIDSVVKAEDPLTLDGVTEYNVEELFDKAYDLGFIRRSGKKFVYNNTIGEDIELGINKSFSITALDNDRDVLKEISARV